MNTGGQYLLKPCHSKLEILRCKDLGTAGIAFLWHPILSTTMLDEKGLANRCCSSLLRRPKCELLIDRQSCPRAGLGGAARSWFHSRQKVLDPVGKSPHGPQLIAGMSACKRCYVDQDTADYRQATPTNCQHHTPLMPIQDERID